MSDTCGSGYPPSPCPTPTHSTTAPPHGGPPGTAFTGADLTAPSLVLMFLLLLAGLSFALRHLFGGEGDL